MPDSPPNSCYKFIVDSADEAVTAIRQRLGPSARVLSVRSIEPSGLRRLWSGPKIEVIAQLDPPPPAASAPSAPAAPADVPLPPAPRQRRTLDDLLLRSGLSEQALHRLRMDRSWPELSAAPLHRSFAEMARRLHASVASRPARPPLSRAAFLGGPGVGRTTALCKWLAVEVFRRGRVGHVVTVEFDRPNSAGSLPVFCEALGVPLAHFPASTQPAAPGGFVYFDLPGLSLLHRSENHDIARFLEAERIEERVLVLNAAYDRPALQQAYATGRELGATHVVFTHLDEVPQWGKLWDYLFDPEIEPLFLSCGPSLTGDCEEDVSGALVRRTLPIEPEDPAS
ncbi:MAG TPA: flagellar GTP-binding protein [Opitutus sp.]|nr:flagellar GTP-binding protein [Opitutus sp.]